MTPTAVTESKAAERLILAMLLSIGLHLAFLVAIPARVDGPRAEGPTPIIATLERPPSTENAATGRGRSETIGPAAEKALVPSQQQPVAVESAPAQSPSKAASGEAPPVLDIPVIRDPTYYSVGLLDEHPRPLRSVEPRYPPQASRQGITGTVTLRLLIDETGTLNEIAVVTAEPEGIFDEAAMAAFRDMQFSPARKNGRAVRSRVRITVGFESR